MLSKLFLVLLNADFLLVGNYRASKKSLHQEVSLQELILLVKWIDLNVVEIFYSISNHCTQNAASIYLLVERWQVRSRKVTALTDQSKEQMCVLLNVLQQTSLSDFRAIKV